MSESLPEAEVKKLEASLMERMRRVAGASGGVLGLGSKVSKQEAAVLQKLSRAFERPMSYYIPVSSRAATIPRDVVAPAPGAQR